MPQFIPYCLVLLRRSHGGAHENTLKRFPASGEVMRAGAKSKSNGTLQSQLASQLKAGDYM